MNQYSKQFIVDLSKLLRHGSDPFDRLISDLSDPNQRRKLIEALTQLREIASESRRPKSSASRRHKSFTYSDIKIPDVANGDAAITDLLISLRDSLVGKPALKRRRVLSDICYELNISIAKRDNIPRIIQKILDDIATRDSRELDKALNAVNEADTGSTESFMELASFITGGSRNA